MKEIKRYTIEAMKDYSDCWIDIDEDYTNEHLINHGDYWCKSKDVADLELDHRAVVESLQADKIARDVLIAGYEKRIEELEAERNEFALGCTYLENGGQFRQELLDKAYKILEAPQV